MHLYCLFIVLHKLILRSIGGRWNFFMAFGPIVNSASEIPPVVFLFDRSFYTFSDHRVRVAFLLIWVVRLGRPPSKK